jgi:hypothetical protein
MEEFQVCRRSFCRFLLCGRSVSGGGDEGDAWDEHSAEDGGEAVESLDGAADVPPTRVRQAASDSETTASKSKCEGGEPLETAKVNFRREATQSKQRQVYCLSPSLLIIAEEAREQRQPKAIFCLPFLAFEVSSRRRIGYTVAVVLHPATGPPPSHMMNGTACNCASVVCSLH